MGENNFFSKYLTIWVNDNHNLAILGYPHKKARKKSFGIFLTLDFFGHCRYVNKLKKKQKSFCCNLFLCSPLFGLNVLDYNLLAMVL